MNGRRNLSRTNFSGCHIFGLCFESVQRASVRRLIVMKSASVLKSKRSVCACHRVFWLMPRLGCIGCGAPKTCRTVGFVTIATERNGALCSGSRGVVATGRYRTTKRLATKCRGRPLFAVHWCCVAFCAPVRSERVVHVERRSASSSLRPLRTVVLAATFLLGSPNSVCRPSRGHAPHVALWQSQTLRLIRPRCRTLRRSRSC